MTEATFPGLTPGSSVVLRLLSDERLARRAAKGDERAFEVIYRRYHQDLYRFCLAMTGNSQDAQDALQNTMVKVLRALPGEERTIKLRPWLYRIARNESIEALRKRRDNAELGVERAGGSEVSETAETRERLRTLLADLDQLPKRQRAILVMRELSGLGFGEIGTAFGTSAAVARQTLYEARMNLRQLEEGRERRCAEVMKELSDGDGRVIRRRKIRSHLRSCPDCRAFCDEIGMRRQGLAALAPLPLAASISLLRDLLGTQAGGPGAGIASGGSLAGSVGIGAGKTVATSAIAKSAATVAAVAAVGVSAGERGGLIDVPLPGKSGQAAVQRTAESHGSVVRSDSTVKTSVATPGTGAAATQPAGADRARTQSRDEDASYDSSAKPQQIVARSGSPFNSQNGSIPPGNGYGRSAPERHGRPEQLPEAAGQGQQNASAHKPSHASSPPAQSAGAGAPNQSTGGGASPAAKPVPASNAQGPHPGPAAPQPPIELPSQANGSPPEPGATPPGLED